MKTRQGDAIMKFYNFLTMFILLFSFIQVGNYLLLCLIWLGWKLAYPKAFMTLIVILDNEYEKKTMRNFSQEFYKWKANTRYNFYVPT